MTGSSRRDVVAGGGDESSWSSPEKGRFLRLEEDVDSESGGGWKENGESL